MNRVSKALLPLAAACAALTLTGGAAAQAYQPASPEAARPENLADMQCMAVYGYLAGQGDENVAAGALGMFYFLGRLEGRAPDVDWMRELYLLTDTLTDEAIAPHFQRCGQLLIDRGEAMQAAAAQYGGD